MKFEWSGIKINMTPMNYWNSMNSQMMTSALERTSPANKFFKDQCNALKPCSYKPTNIDYLYTAQDHLLTIERALLHSVLKKNEEVFQAQARQWNGDPIVIKLKPDA